MHSHVWPRHFRNASHINQLTYPMKIIKNLTARFMIWPRGLNTIDFKTSLSTADQSLLPPSRQWGGCQWWCTTVNPAPWPHITSTLTSSEMHPKAPLMATGGPSVPLNTPQDHCIVCPHSLCALKKMPKNVLLAVYDAAYPPSSRDVGRACAVVTSVSALSAGWWGQLDWGRQVLFIPPAGQSQRPAAGN